LSVTQHPLFAVRHGRSARPAEANIGICAVSTSEVELRDRAAPIAICCPVVDAHDGEAPTAVRNGDPRTATQPPPAR
jgi:hypothetical protein